MDTRIYNPPQLAKPCEVCVTPWSFQSLGIPLYVMNSTTPAAAAWLAAGLVTFVPFTIPEPMTVTKLFYGIGAAAGNVDMGLYNEDATRIVSVGSTAAAGANDVHVLDVADTVLNRGRYYIALVCDTVTTLTVFRTAPAAPIGQALGLLEQAGVTLPLSTGASPATFAKYTRASVPMMGLQGYRTFGP